jgi:hypothetical protein
LRRIEQATGVRRETASAYLKTAGIAVRPPGVWGRRAPAKPANGVTTDSDPAKSKAANEVTTEPGTSFSQNERPPDSPQQSASGCAPYREFIEQGRAVGLLARQMFPGGVEVRSEGDLDRAIRATRELIENRDVPAIFEGTFEHNGALVRVDVLHRCKDERWRLIEVKSTTDVKDHHLEDVAIQHRVVSRSGVDLAASCLAHVSRDYVYEGGPIDASRFFRIRNLTRQVEKLRTNQPFFSRFA